MRVVCLTAANLVSGTTFACNSSQLHQIFLLTQMYFYFIRNTENKIFNIDNHGGIKLLM